VQLTAQKPSGDRALHEREHWKTPRRASCEELGPKHTNTRVSEPINITLDDHVTFQAEITT
jgi:hypothetical protein